MDQNDKTPEAAETPAPNDALEGFDLSELFTDDEAEAKSPEAEATKADADESDDEQYMTPEDLDKMIRAGVAATIEELREKARQEAEAGELDPRDARIKELESQLKERESTNSEQKEAEERKAVEHEVRSAVGKLKMSDAQVEATVRYFEKNRDLEGVVSFEKAALRVNPELSDPSQGPSPATNGAEGFAKRNAEVITRSSTGGARSQRPTFKPGIGKYDDVTAFIRSSGAAARIMQADRQ